MKRQAVRSPHIPEPPPQTWSPPSAQATAGGKMNDVAKMTIFLADIKPWSRYALSAFS